MFRFDNSSMVTPNNTKKVKRNVLTQSQVTYTWYKPTPRFKLLQPREDGAWIG